MPEADIKQACERFGMSLDTWRRQKRAFGLLEKVYTKRAKIRGEQLRNATAQMTLPEPGAKLQTDASPVFQAWLEHEGPEPET